VALGHALSMRIWLRQRRASVGAVAQCARLAAGDGSCDYESESRGGTHSACGTPQAPRTITQRETAVVAPAAAVMQVTAGASESYSVRETAFDIFVTVPTLDGTILKRMRKPVQVFYGAGQWGR